MFLRKFALLAALVLLAVAAQGQAQGPAASPPPQCPSGAPKTIPIKWETPDNATEAYKPLTACCGDVLSFSWKKGKNHGVVQVPGPACPSGGFTPGSNGQVQVAPQANGGSATATLPPTKGTVYYADDAPADKTAPGGKTKCEDGVFLQVNVSC